MQKFLYNKSLRHGGVILWMFLCLPFVNELRADLLISEFSASNSGVPMDEDGNSPDWLEVHNPTNSPIELEGWHLTDDPDSLDKWPFSPGTIPANSRIVVFASGKDRRNGPSPLHTNFRLSSDAGSSISLSRSTEQGGITVVSQFDSYPEQFENWSFGTSDDPGVSIGYFETPTPGTPNGKIDFEGIVADTEFSIDRGFYDEPFEVEISTATPGATIIYTIDGTKPQESPLNGIRINAPAQNQVPVASVTVSKTTNLRAIAVKPNFLPTNIDTQTYLFRADILQQNSGSVPAHSSWGHAGPDYEMDPQIVNHQNPEIRPLVTDFLRVPTLSLTMNWEEMFGSQGIYRSGQGVERDTSIEYLNPERDLDNPNMAKGFQHDGTVQIVGGSSTNRWKSDKLSMRLKFSTDLRFELFGKDRTDRFDTLVIDNRLNNVWHYNPGSGAGPGQAARAQYTRDQFPADLHNFMGGLSPEGHHCLLFINGVFWGVTELHERPDDNFAAEYLGGDNSDYDVVKHRTNTVVSGSNASYLQMLNLTRRDLENPENFSAVSEVLDLENFIAYMLANYYVGNTDWAHQNWYASYGRDRPGGKWFYHSWDPEHCLENTNDDVTEKDNSGGPTEVIQNLIKNQEFRIMFADAVQRHFYHDGILTPERVAEVYLQRADAVDFVTRLESARWGDNGDTRRNNPYTRLDWLRNRDQLLGRQSGSGWANYFPLRTNIVLNQFDRRGWLPDLSAPTVIPTGGEVEPGTSVTLDSIDDGSIYFTTDGSDPRLAAIGDGGTTTTLIDVDALKYAMMPVDNSLDELWMKPEFDPDLQGNWSEGIKGAGYELSGSDYSPLIDENLDFEDQVDSQIQETIYLRVPFSVSNLSELRTLNLGLRYDDGFVAYLNGNEIARINAEGPQNTIEPFDANATASHQDSLAVNFETFDISEHLDLLNEGSNLLAIHSLNRNTGSSDQLIWPTLEASDQPKSGGAISPGAMRYTAAIQLQRSINLRARVLKNNEWSALTNVRFTVGTIPANSSNLAITEISYRPQSPSAAEAAAGFDQRSDFEFIELTNISPNEIISLENVGFTQGIQFDFSRDASSLELGPGKSLVLVKNLAAFEFRFGNEFQIAGVFQNGTQLANGGEMITLKTLPDNSIRSFSYDDQSPWPTEADGNGSSLQLANPFSNPDHRLPTSWIAGTPSPGEIKQIEPEGYAVWAADFGEPSATSDLDKDNLPALLEYLLGTSPLVANSSPISIHNSENSVDISFTYRNEVSDAELFLETSNDLENWTVVAPESLAGQGDGTIIATAKFLHSEGTKKFVRLGARFR